MRIIYGLGLLIFLLGACQEKERERYTLKIKGSESMHETFNALKDDFEKFQDSITVVIEGGGSRTGMMSVNNGQAEIGLSSFGFDLDEELSRDHGVLEQIVAYDGIVVICNEHNPIARLTNRQIQSIFTGEITNWAQLGGRNGEVLPIIRDGNSGTQKFFTSYFGVDETSSTSKVAHENAEIVDLIQHNPNGIGFIGFAYFTESVRTLPLLMNEGVEQNRFVTPSFKNLTKGIYPLKRSLRVYYRAESSKAVEVFLRYLQTERARFVIEAHGLISKESVG